jgi:hypothetical protein
MATTGHRWTRPSRPTDNGGPDGDARWSQPLRGPSRSLLPAAARSDAPGDLPEFCLRLRDLRQSAMLDPCSDACIVESLLRSS